MKPEKIKTCFISLHYGSNPYLKTLQEHLLKFGVQVTYMFHPSIFFIHEIYKRGVDVVHFHDFAWFRKQKRLYRRICCYFLLTIQLILLRATKIKIVASLHNPIIKSNNKPLLPFFWSKIIFGLTNSVIVHYPVELDDFKIPLNTKKINLIPHPHYCDHYKNSISQNEAKAKLNLSSDSFVFAFFGYINPPKGTLELVQCFEKISEKDVKLLIAGYSNHKQYGERIMDIAKKNKDIIFENRHIHDDELQILMSASDCVVLPYWVTTSSGALVLAMSFGKACIAPRGGHFKYLLDEKGGFLYCFDQGRSALLTAMNEVLRKREIIPEMGKHNIKKIKQYDWDTAAKKTFSTYKQ